MIVPEDAAATMNRMLRRASPANLPGADPTPVAMRETTWHTAKTGMFTDDYRCVRRPFQGPPARGRPRSEAALTLIHYRLQPAIALPPSSAANGSDRG